MHFSTKLLLLALSSAIGLCLGAAYSKSLKRKQLFFAEFSDFIDKVLNDLSFRQDGIRRVCTEFAESCRSSSLKNILQEYSLNPDAALNAPALSKDEKREVFDVFSGLGRSDVVTQRAALENNKQKISTIKERHTAKCAKQCSTAVKLGLLFGLAVGIILL